MKQPKTGTKQKPQKAKQKKDTQLNNAWTAKETTQSKKYTHKTHPPKKIRNQQKSNTQTVNTYNKNKRIRIQNKINKTGKHKTNKHTNKQTNKTTNNK